jgi:hypothetical protein
VSREGKNGRLKKGSKIDSRIAVGEIASPLNVRTDFALRKGGAGSVKMVHLRFAERRQRFHERLRKDAMPRKSAVSDREV